MEDRHEKREQHEVLVLQQDGEDRDLVLVLARTFREPAREIVVDRIRRHEQHRADAKDRERGHQPEHDDRPEDIGGAAGDRGGDGVSGVVEALVAADAARERLRSDDAERDRRDGRREDRARDAGDGLRRADEIEIRDERKREAARRHGQRAGDNDRSLATRGVDEGACRRLRDQPCEAGDRHHQPRRRRVPALARAAHGDEVDREIRPEPVAHVGKEEIERVEPTQAARRRSPLGPLALVVCRQTASPVVRRHAAASSSAHL